MDYTITKAIAKHGKDAIIIVPRLLGRKLKPGTIVQANIRILGMKNREDD